MTAAIAPTSQRAVAQRDQRRACTKVLGGIDTTSFRDESLAGKTSFRVAGMSAMDSVSAFMLAVVNVAANPRTQGPSLLRWRAMATPRSSALVALLSGTALIGFAGPLVLQME